MSIKSIYQFKITLLDTAPSIWRRIQVPISYSFWELHVAIQNAMGWLDYHLHEFIVIDPNSGKKRLIGIANEDDFYNTTSPSWKVKIKQFIKLNPTIRYIYDLVDRWEHEIKFEGIYLNSVKTTYPLCLDGERACPPECIGGALGYKHFLKVISDAKNPGYKDMLDWAGGSFDAKGFDPNCVSFQNPEKHRESNLPFVSIHEL